MLLLLVAGVLLSASVKQRGWWVQLPTLFNADHVVKARIASSHSSCELGDTQPLASQSAQLKTVVHTRGAEGAGGECGGCGGGGGRGGSEGGRCGRAGAEGGESGELGETWAAAAQIFMFTPMFNISQPEFSPVNENS